MLCVQHDVFCSSSGNDKLGEVKHQLWEVLIISPIFRVVQRKAHLLNSLHRGVSLPSEGSSQTPCNNFVLMKLFQPLQLSSLPNNAFSVSH